MPVNLLPCQVVDDNKNIADPPSRPRSYWRLWLLDALLVGVGVLIFFAAQYGTAEFSGIACLMALVPFIPVMVLVGGAGSWIFILTKARLDRSASKKSWAIVLLAGPGVVFLALCILLVAGKSPARRLAYICHGTVPASAAHVRITGYSTYLSEEWLAVFNVDQKDFQALLAQAQLVPADGFELRAVIDKSSLKRTKLYQSFPAPDDLLCFKRVFNRDSEHERGAIFAVFDPATSTAAVLREYHD